MRAWVVLMLAALGGCELPAGEPQTARGYAQALDTWLNFPEANLVRHWGAPHRVYESGDTKFLTWVDRETAVIPGTPPSYVSSRVGNTTFVDAIGGTDPAVINYRCETTFEIREGMIRNWRYRGNSCIAPERK